MLTPVTVEDWALQWCLRKPQATHLQVFVLTAKCWNWVASPKGKGHEPQHKHVSCHSEHKLKGVETGEEFQHELPLRRFNMEVVDCTASICHPVSSWIQENWQMHEVGFCATSLGIRACAPRMCTHTHTHAWICYCVAFLLFFGTWIVWLPLSHP